MTRRLPRDDADRTRENAVASAIVECVRGRVIVSRLPDGKFILEIHERLPRDSSQDPARFQVHFMDLKGEEAVRLRSALANVLDLHEGIETSR